MGPDVQINGSQIINYHRVDGDIDYFLFVAAAPSTYAVTRKTVVTDVDSDVVLPRRTPDAAPVLLDLWTGDITPIAQYEELSESQIKLRVNLKAYSSMMVAILPLRKKPIHVVTSNALSARHDEDGLYLRVNSTGAYAAALSNGKTVHKSITEIPESQELKGWDLSVQSWEPTSNISSSETVYKMHHFKDLETLSPWTSYEELQDVSGVGSYCTNFTLQDWPPLAGAILEIPEFTGSFRVKVNGEDLPPQNQLNTEFDVGPWLKNGENQLVITVATPLLNRLRVVTPETYGIAERQDYGLISPIMLKPYIEEKII